MPPETCFQARSGSGNPMFVHELDDVDGIPNYFVDRCLSSRGAAADGWREEATLVLAAYLSWCDHVAQQRGCGAGSTTFALNESFQALHAIPAQGFLRSEFWVRRQQVVKSLYAASFPVVNQLLAPPSEAPPTAAAPASFACVRGFGAELISDEVTNAAAVEVDQWPRVCFWDPATGLFLHVWRSHRAAREFTTTMARVWQACLEYRLLAQGLVAAPVVGLVGYHGWAITVMPIAPVQLSMPLTPTKDDGGSMASAILGCLLSELRLALAAAEPPDEETIAILERHSEKSPGAAALRASARGFLLRALDGRYYYIMGGGVRAVSVSIACGTAALRPEAVPLVVSSWGELRSGAPGTPLAQCTPHDLKESLLATAVPLLLKNMADELKRLLTSGGAAAKDGGLSALLTKLCTSEYFVTRALHAYGINIGLIADVVRAVEQTAASEGIPLSSSSAVVGIAPELLQRRQILAAMRDVLLIETAVRVVKHMIRGELTQLQQSCRSDAMTSGHAPLRILEHVHRVMALAVNAHPGFWAQLNCAAAALYGLDRPEGSDGQIVYSMQLVKIIAWHVTIKFGMPFDQEAGRFAPKFVVVSLATAALSPPALMRLAAVGQTRPVANSITRQWETFAAGSLPLEVARAEHPPAALAPNGGMCISIAPAERFDAVPEMFRAVNVLRVGYLELLVRWGNKQSERLRKIAAYIGLRVLPSLLAPAQDDSMSERLAIALMLAADTCGLADHPDRSEMVADVSAVFVQLLARAQQQMPSLGGISGDDPVGEFAFWLVATRRRSLAGETLRLLVTLLRDVFAHGVNGSQPSVITPFVRRFAMSIAAEIVALAGTQHRTPSSTEASLRETFAAVACAVSIHQQCANNGSTVALSLGAAPRDDSTTDAVYASVLRYFQAALLGGAPSHATTEEPAVDENALDTLAAWLLSAAAATTPRVVSFLLTASWHAVADAPRSRASASLRSDMERLLRSTDEGHGSSGGAAGGNVDDALGQLAVALVLQLWARLDSDVSLRDRRPPQRCPKTTPFRVRLTIATAAMVSHRLTASPGPIDAPIISLMRRIEAAAASIQGWLYRIAAKRALRPIVWRHLFRPAAAVVKEADPEKQNHPRWPGLLLRSQSTTTHGTLEMLRWTLRFHALNATYYRAVAIAYRDIVTFPAALRLLGTRESSARLDLYGTESSSMALVDASWSTLVAERTRAALIRDEESRRHELIGLSYLSEVAEPLERALLWLTLQRDGSLLLQRGFALHDLSLRFIVQRSELIERHGMVTMHLAGAQTLLAQRCIRQSTLTSVAHRETIERSLLVTAYYIDVETLHRDALQPVLHAQLDAMDAMARQERLRIDEQIERNSIVHDFWVTLEPVERRGFSEEESLDALGIVLHLNTAVALREVQVMEADVRVEIANRFALSVLDVPPNDGSVFIEDPDSGHLVEYCGDDPTFWGWSLLARQTVIVQDYYPAMMPLLFEKESLGRKDITAQETKLRQSYDEAYAAETSGLMLELWGAKEASVRDELLAEALLARCSMYGALLNIVWAQLYDEESTARLRILTDAESDARTLLHQCCVKERLTAFVHLTPLTSVAVVASAELSERLHILTAAHVHGAYALHATHLGCEAIPLLQRSAELFRSALLEQENTARASLYLAAQRGQGTAMVQLLFRHTSAFRRDLARTERQDFTTLLVAAHGDFRVALWRMQSRVALGLVEHESESVHAAMDAAERRVLQSRYKLLVIEDRQEVMREEHHGYCRLRELRDLLFVERDARRGLISAEGEAWEVLCVQDVVWRAHGGVEGPSALLLESPMRRRLRATSRDRKRRPAPKPVPHTGGATVHPVRPARVDGASKISSLYPSSIMDVVAGLVVKESAARASIVEEEGQAWEGLRRHRPKDGTDAGPCEPDLYHRRPDRVGLSRAFVKALEVEESRRRAAIEFDRERAVVLFTLEFKPPPPPQVPPALSVGRRLASIPPRSLASHKPIPLLPRRHRLEPLR